MTTAEELFNQLSTLTYNYLNENCPKLSGSMSEHIEIVSMEKNKIVICVSAPFYDMKEWKKTGKIKYTGESINGVTDYAVLVNQFGAFGTQNKSMHWANRVCVKSADAVTPYYDAEVKHYVEL